MHNTKGDVALINISREEIISMILCSVQNWPFLNLGMFLELHEAEIGTEFGIHSIHSWPPFLFKKTVYLGLRLNFLTFFYRFQRSQMSLLNPCS